VLTISGGNLPGPMRLTFIVSLVGIALLYATLIRYEIAAKTTRMQVRRLRRQLSGDDSLRPLKRSAAPS
jgi:heme exporter protein C